MNQLKVYEHASLSIREASQEANVPVWFVRKQIQYYNIFSMDGRVSNAAPAALRELWKQFQETGRT